MASKTLGKTAQSKKKTAAVQLREKTIEAYQERIRQDEEKIAAMEVGRNVLSKTNIVGLAVTHKSFGAGTIIVQDHATITVKFDFGSKRFIMPSAFLDGFLTTADADTNSKFTQYQDMGAQIKTAKEDISAANRSIKVLESK